jgi:hypothetical protein
MKAIAALVVVFFLSEGNLNTQINIDHDKQPHTSLYIAIGMGDCKATACVFMDQWIEEFAKKYEISYKHILPDLDELILEEILYSRFEDNAPNIDVTINTNLYERMNGGVKTTMMFVDTNLDTLFNGDSQFFYEWAEKYFEGSNTQIGISFEHILSIPKALPSFILNFPIFVDSNHIFIHGAKNENLYYINRKETKKANKLLPDEKLIEHLFEQNDFDNSRIKKKHVSINETFFDGSNQKIYSIVTIDIDFDNKITDYLVALWIIEPNNHLDQELIHMPKMPFYDNFKIDHYGKSRGQLINTYDDFLFISVYNTNFLRGAVHDSIPNLPIFAKLKINEKRNGIEFIDFVKSALFQFKINKKEFYFNLASAINPCPDVGYVFSLEAPVVVSLDNRKTFDFATLIKSKVSGPHDIIFCHYSCSLKTFLYVMRDKETALDTILIIEQDGLGGWIITHTEAVEFVNPIYSVDNMENILVSSVNKSKDLTLYKMHLTR